MLSNGKDGVHIVNMTSEGNVVECTMNCGADSPVSFVSIHTTHASQLTNGFRRTYDLWSTYSSREGYGSAEKFAQGNCSELPISLYETYFWWDKRRYIFDEGKLLVGMRLGFGEDISVCRRISVPYCQLYLVLFWDSFRFPPAAKTKFHAQMCECMRRPKWPVKR